MGHSRSFAGACALTLTLAVSAAACGSSSKTSSAPTASATSTSGGSATTSSSSASGNSGFCAEISQANTQVGQAQQSAISSGQLPGSASVRAVEASVAQKLAGEAPTPALANDFRVDAAYHAKSDPAQADEDAAEKAVGDINKYVVPRCNYLTFRD